MKKIILGLGAVTTITAPIATVISCNGNGDGPVINMSDLAKNSKLFFEAFNNTFGGQDVSKSAKYINEKYTEILNEKDTTKQVDDLKEYIAIIAKQVSVINYSSDINYYNVGTSNKAVEQIETIFDVVYDALDPKLIDTDAKAQAAGFDNLAQVTKARKEFEEGPYNIHVAPQGINSKDENRRKNSITISENIDVLANTVIAPFYKTTQADITNEWSNLLLIWDQIKIDNNSSVDQDALNRFVALVGNKLNSIAPDQVQDLNKFVSTTPLYVKSKWENIWGELETITSSYKTDDEAKDMGFSSNVIANKISGKLAILKAVSISQDASGDKNAITIATKSDNKLEQYSKELFESFDGSIGGKDVSKQFAYIINSYKELLLNPMPDKTKAFILPIASALAATGFDSPAKLNLINPFVYPTIAKSWSEILEYILNKLTDIDNDTIAREWGFTDESVVRLANRSTNVMAQIAAAPYSMPYSDLYKNSIVIGKNAKADLDQIIFPFADVKSVNVSTAWKEFLLNYEFIKVHPSADTSIMFLQVGQALLRYDKAHPSVDPKLLLDASTTASDLTNWEEIFYAVSQIANGFQDDKEAQEYGFVDNASAKKAAAIASKFSKITKAQPGANSTLTIS